MSYSEIIILGWNINGLMFIVNLFIVINSSGSNDPTQMQRQSEKLKELKEEIEDIFPLRKYDIFITYFVPFTALFKVSYRVYEMNLFFKANEGTKLYDFMVYKLEKDISNRKNN